MNRLGYPYFVKEIINNFCFFQNLCVSKFRELFDQTNDEIFL